MNVIATPRPPPARSCGGQEAGRPIGFAHGCGLTHHGRQHGEDELAKRMRVAWLPDGRRLHVQNGPLNLVMQAFGRPSHVGRAYDAAITRAREICQELACDLAALREGGVPRGAAAWGALRAVARLPDGLDEGWGGCVALNGAVADEVLAAMKDGAPLERGFVNNRGAVALHLAEGHALDMAATEWPGQRRLAGRAPLDWTSRTRALVTAGWHFAPYALGCLDTIWVGAGSAAQAAGAAAAIALAAAPGAILAEHGVPLSAFGEAGAQLVLPAGLKLLPEDAALLLDQSYGRAEALREAGLVTMALMGAQGQERLSAASHVTLELLNATRH